MAKEYINAFKTEDGRPVGDTHYQVEGLAPNDVLDGKSMVDEYIVLKSAAASLEFNITGDDIRVIKETASSKTIQNYGKKDSSIIQVTGLTADTKVTIKGSISHFISNNQQLTEIDVNHCTQLIYMDFSNNQLTTLDVSGCTNVSQIYCQNNAGLLVYFPQSDVEKHVVYGYDDDDVPPTQEHIAKQVALLPYSGETSYLYIPYGEIYDEIPDAVKEAAAEKGWEITSNDY